MGLMGAAGMGDGSGMDGNGSQVLQEQSRLLARSEPQESWGAAGNRDRDPQVGWWPPWSHCCSWNQLLVSSRGRFWCQLCSSRAGLQPRVISFTYSGRNLKKKSKKEEEKQMLQAISLVQTKQRAGLSLGRLMGHSGMWIELGES